MTTLTRMKEDILKNKLIAFMKRHRHTVTRKPKVLFFEHLPRDVVGRCCSFRKISTNHIVGFDILLSSYYIRHYPDNLTAYKHLLLHEIAHTNTRSRGHDMKFRKTARRIGCDRSFVSSYVYVNK